jgi:Flp pilus assembly protein TadG
VRWTWGGEDVGQSLVELALSLPLMVFLLLGGADMARAFAIQLAVQNGARAGAEAAAIDYSPTQAKAVARACDEMARTPALDTTNCTTDASVTVTFKEADGTTDCPNPPVSGSACYATVEVRYTFKLITAWPLIPSSFAFDRSTSMRMFAAP